MCLGRSLSQPARRRKRNRRNRKSHALSLATARKHRRQFTPAEINGLGPQSAVPRDPPAHAVRIMRQQIFSPRGVGLCARQAEIPGGVESEHSARRHADAIVWDHAEQKRAGRCAGAVDHDAAARISGAPHTWSNKCRCARRCHRAGPRAVMWSCQSPAPRSQSWRSPPPYAAWQSNDALRTAFLPPQSSRHPLTIRIPRDLEQES
jgi:hypothetical protein